jgi:serine/threonine protein kinase
MLHSFESVPRAKGASPTLPVEIGEIVEGKYRIERHLASGGMGTLAVATHLALRQEVVIKFMSPMLLESDNESGIRRFTAEARAAARIHSEHVAHVFDVSSLPNGAPFIVMEYLEGLDLSELLEQRGHLPYREAVDYVLQACEAVAEAHAAGVVHRDLKPANLFRCQRADGRFVVKVLDFGVSKLLPKGDVDASDFTSTGPNVVMGTPLYSSPEQLRGAREVDERTDVWALGVIVYELIAGRPPFAGTTFMEICAKVAYAPPPPLRALRQDVPPGLWEVLVRSLAKDPALRIQSVVELADALTPYAPTPAALVVERIVGVPPPRNGAGGEIGTLPAIERPATPPSTRPDRLRLRGIPRSAWRLATVGAVVALALLAGLFVGQSAPERATALAASAPGEAVGPRGAPEAPPHAASASASVTGDALGAPAATAPAPSPSLPARRAAPARRPSTAEFGGML